MIRLCKLAHAAAVRRGAQWRLEQRERFVDDDGVFVGDDGVAMFVGDDGVLADVSKLKTEKE